MLAAGDPMQTLGPGRDPAAFAKVALEQRQVEFTTLDRAPGLHAQPAAYVEAQTRARASKVRQQLGQPIGRKILRHAEPHHAFAVRSRHNIERLLLQRENPPSVGHKPLPLFGRRRLLPPPLQQWITQRVFQSPDLLADGRLRAVYALARAGEATGVDDRDEAAEKVDVEHGGLIHKSTGNYFII